LSYFVLNTGDLAVTKLVIIVIFIARDLYDLFLNFINCFI
jgi:hypothetical protein